MANAIAGVQLYTCRDFTKTIEGVADTLKKVKDIGYKSVQISGFGPVDPKEVAKIVEDLGLDVGERMLPGTGFLAILTPLSKNTSCGIASTPPSADCSASMITTTQKG